jgi:hypothetical protein
MTAPGWYPDPSGDGTQRYWDGNAWGPVAPPPAAPPQPTPPAAPPVVVIKKKRSMLSLLVLGGVALLAGSCIVSAIGGTGSKKSSTGSSTSSTPTTQSYSADRMEREVVLACEMSVKKQLKDPDSAKFGDDWQALPVERDPSVPVPERLVNAGFSPPSGDKQYVATGSVNAKNSFGGYAGSQMYGCDAFFSTKSGDATGIAYSIG